MSDDTADARPPPSEADAREGLVESIATVEETPEAAIERLVSSYWTLTEMYDMLDEIGLDAEIDPDDAAMEETMFDDVPAAETVADDLEEVRDRLDRLETRVKESSETREEIEADLADLTQRVDAIGEQLRTRQSSLESRFDSELASLETILEYLIDTTEELDADVESLSGEFEAVRRRRGEREQLADLRRSAIQVGVRSAACDQCGNTVDIGLLPSVNCPHCDRQFVDVDPADGWFAIGSDTLVTADDEEPETQ